MKPVAVGPDAVVSLKIELYDNSYRWTFLPIEGQKKFDLGTTRADCNKRKP